ncbi:MAG TPA: ATP-dependent DNA helicase RecQ [Alloiococcus sp.]|nr:ATP-dependent DNA helicase RecQ [Alloiococcus sp.]
MRNNLEALLYQQFGYNSFREGQKEAIESVMEDKDTLVILPTGSGKSICYQLYPFIMSGTTIIVSPLLSLMQDQVNKLRAYGIKEVCALNSLVTRKEKQYIYKHLASYKYIFLSPEMLSMPNVVDQLKKIRVNLLVVDEAHCVTQWGMDFRPDYLDIAKFREQVKTPPIMALTATATKRVQDEIKQLLHFKKQHQTIETTVDRPEIKLAFEKVSQADKDNRLLEIVKQIQKPGIIYFSSKQKANEITDMLIEEGQLNAESYHADKESQDKITIQNQFLENQLQVICATSAFGMGVNKKDIKFVIHYHIPGSPEMYLQEIGRCSRNKEPGLALTLYSPGDENIQRFLKNESIPEPNTIQYVYHYYNQVKNTEDVQFKLIKYFYKNGYSVEETIQYFNDRKESVNNQISYLLSLIGTQQCKRSYLLNYFDETKNKPLSFCCSQCQPNLITQFYTQENISNTQEKLQSFHKILKSLYNLDTTSCKSMLK